MLLHCGQYFNKKAVEHNKVVLKRNICLLEENKGIPSLFTTHLFIGKVSNCY